MQNACWSSSMSIGVPESSLLELDELNRRENSYVMQHVSQAVQLIIYVWMTTSIIIKITTIMMIVMIEGSILGHNICSSWWLDILSQTNQNVQIVLNDITHEYGFLQITRRRKNFCQKMTEIQLVIIFCVNHKKHTYQVVRDNWQFSWPSKYTLGYFDPRLFVKYVPFENSLFLDHQTGDLGNFKLSYNILTQASFSALIEADQWSLQK